MITIDIDTGGTMTDALVTDGDKRYAFKVDTTPHDFTVSFMNCLNEATATLGFESVDALLEKTKIIRWSSTITTNVLAERRGSRVGLMVSEGNEESFYGAERSPVLGELIEPASVFGLSREPTAVEVLSGLKSLLEAGVRRVCVCLKGSFPANDSENAVKYIIEDQYPDHIIGSVPVLLGSEMAMLRDDQTRVHYSLMNAYTHSQLANSLFKAEDLLREDHHWQGSLLIGHTSGGVSRVGKTKAVDTIESGPVFGTFGGAHMAKIYGLKSVVCFDVGGTTTKASMVRDGAPVFQRGGELMGIPVKASFAMLRSAAVGGGSVARVREGRLHLGPDSAGAVPGPAAYGLGGRSATLTDALLILGYLDPARFFGGRRELNEGLARKAIEQHIAGPLGVSVEEAALAMRDAAVDQMVRLVGNLLAETGADASETAIFAFGGNGPVFAALVAEKLGLSSAHVFDLGPVFSTFGSAVSNVVHTYTHGLDGTWSQIEKEGLASAARGLIDQAERDLRGEGFDPKGAKFSFVVEFGDSEEQITSVSVEAQGGWTDPAADLSAAVSAAGKTSQNVLALNLNTEFELAKHDLAPRRAADRQAMRETRKVYLHGTDGVDATIATWEALGFGDVVDGPAVINGDTLTCPVPAGWQATLDEQGNARLATTTA